MIDIGTKKGSLASASRIISQFKKISNQFRATFVDYFEHFDCKQLDGAMVNGDRIVLLERQEGREGKGGRKEGRDGREGTKQLTNEGTKE